MKSDRPASLAAVVAVVVLHQVMYVGFRRHGVCHTEEPELLVSGSASATWIVDSESCDVCNSAAETTSRIIFGCTSARQFWQAVGISNDGDWAMKS